MYLGSLFFVSPHICIPKSSFSEGWVVVEETPTFPPGSVPSIAENAAAQVHADVMRLSGDDGDSVASAAAVTTLTAVFMQVPQHQHPEGKLQLR